MNYNVEVIGLDKLIEKLTLATAQETLNPPLKSAGKFLEGWIGDNRFITGGGSGKVHPTKLTKRSGRLLGSITSKIRDKFELVIGTNVEYAPQHEFGGAVNRISKLGKAFTANYPARPFLRPSIENEENISKITLSINKAIQEALSK